MKKISQLFFVFFFSVTCNQLFAQTNITGTIVDEKDNTPLESISITIKGTEIGTKTDANGKFSLVAKKGDVLVISSVNHSTRNYEVRDQKNYYITIQKKDRSLDEVIVTTAFGVKKSTRSLGNAQQTLSGEDIAETQRDNFFNALEGKVAGATINTTSGAPGASAQIVLRGFNSVGGDNNALIVLDGVPLNNSVFNQSRLASDLPNRTNDFTNRAADINPDDIESITVLKGPEGAALYGVEAGNGAIIITTKKAKAKKFTLSYENNFRWEQITRFHDVQKVYDNGLNGASVNTTRSFFGPKYAPGTIFYDNAKNFFNVGRAVKHNVTMEGGLGKLGIRGTLSYYNQEGVIPNTGNQKINGRVSMNYQVTKKFEITTNIAYYNQYNRKAFRGLDGYYMNLLRWPLDDDARKWQNISGSRRIVSKTAGVDNAAEANNPYFEVIRNKNFDVTNRFTFNNNLTYHVKNWLQVDWRIAADAFAQNGGYLYDREAFNFNTVGGRIEEYNVNYKGFNSNLLVTAKKSYGKFNVKLMVGQSFDDRTTTTWATSADSVFDAARNLEPRELKVEGYTSTLKRLNSRTQGRDTLTLERSIGVFGDLNIDYNKILYLNLTGRNDWLAEFPIDKRSYFYPSASASFVFTELLPKSNILNFGRLRASIAKTGKRAAPYSNQSTYTPAVSSTNGYGSAYGFGANNPNLFPESQKTFEVGTELKFFKNRLSLDLTYYQIDITNSIAKNARPSYATGFILYTSNIADLQNKGFEAIATFQWIKNKKISWSTTLNFSKNQNVVTKLPLPEFYNSDTWLAGYRSSLYRGKPTTTIGGLDYLRNNKGDILIDPTNGFPIADANYVSIGDRNPDFKMGIVNSFKYKNVSLSFTLDWKKGGDVLNGTEQQLVIAGLSKRTLDRETPRIIPGVLNDGLQNTANPTKNTITLNPYFLNDYYQFRTYAVDFVEKDVNWLRLRDVTVSYNFGPKLLKKLKIFSSANIFVTGTDLFILTNYSGVDPSSNGNTPASGGVGSFAIDLGTTATPIGINTGLRVAFKNNKK